MVRLLQFATISLMLFSCSQPKKEEAQNDQEKKPEDQVSQKLENDTSTAEQDDEYKIVFRKIDNRVLLHVDDSLIYDSGTIGDNPELEIEFFLTKYVEEGKSEIRIECVR